MYGPLNRPLMQEWSKQRYVHTLPLIYFQKLFQFLPQHNPKSPKKGPKTPDKYDIKFRLCTVSRFPPICVIKFNSVTQNTLFTNPILPLSRNHVINVTYVKEMYILKLFIFLMLLTGFSGPFNTCIVMFHCLFKIFICK